MKQIFTFSCLAAIMLSAFSAKSLSASSVAEKQIIFKTTPGAITIPDGKRAYSMDEISFADSSLRGVLQTYNAESLTLAFEDFNADDTLGFRPDGGIVRLSDMRNIYKVTFPSDVQRSSPLAEMRAIDNVVFADLNGYAIPACRIVPDDSYFLSQWGLDSPSDIDINAPEAWCHTTGDEGVAIAIIDGGVQDDHLDLMGRVTGDIGWGWNGHGYHTAGIAGANTDNSMGVAGVNWCAPLISQRIDGEDDEGCYWAVMDAISNGAHILSNSWVLWTVDSLPRYSTVVRHAFANAYKLDKVVVAAVGNDTGFVDNYPANFGQGIIAVAGINSQGEKYVASCMGDHVDVTAPAVYVWSTVPGDYAPWTGTSMAAPFVSGVASLLRSIEPDLANDDIENIIRNRARDLFSPGWDDSSGFGLIRADSAIELLKQPFSMLHLEANGGYTHSTSQHSRFLSGIPWIAPGTYLVVKHEMRSNVGFDVDYFQTPYVWTRGAYSRGYRGMIDSLAATLRFDMPYSEVVPGSITESGCILRTYVYDIYDLGGSHVGWFPCQPSQVCMAYTILGELELEPITSFSTHYDVWTPEERIQLSWTDNNDYEQGFIIERKDATNDVWSAIDTVPNQQYGSYYDYDIIGSETYWYRVKPFTVNQMDIAWTPELQIKALPAPPENVSCRVLPGITCCPVRLSNEVEVTWQEPSPGKQLTPIEYYKVLRKDDYFWNPQKWFGPIYDTVLNICPNESGDIWMYIVMSYDSEGDSSILNNYCTARPGSSNRCPGQIEKDNVGDMLPYEFSLSQNYPNPFNPSTRIDYSVPVDGHVRLDVVDILGRVVCVLVDEIQPAGEYSIEWRGVNSSGSPAASGVYFYRLQTKTHSAAKRMVLLK